MKYIEADAVVLKRSLTDAFEKEVVAFLNTGGGTIYIGVNDDGTVYGIENVDTTMRNIADIITDKIRPSASRLVFPVAKLEDGKMIIEVTVRKGDTLYYVKKYGRSTSGCFVRIGTTTRGMTDDEIDSRLGQIAISRIDISRISSNQKEMCFHLLKLLFTNKGMTINDRSFLKKQRPCER